MFKNSSKLIFFFIIILGTLITISSNSWLGAWIGLEINLLSFIPLIISSNNLISTEASLKYFLTQAFASTILLFSIIMYILSTNLIFQLNLSLNYSSIIICITLILKRGAAPFHFWFPNVIEGLNWYNNLILMTWQKIAPILILSYSLFNQFFILFIVLSIFLGSIGGLNQTSIRKIMAFSSINHIGWIIAAILFNERLWSFYFLIYSFLSFRIIFIFNSFQLFYINQIFSIFANSYLIKFSLLTTLLSLGGLPPFLGFFPKWLVIQSLVNINQIFLVFLIITITLITLYFYLRIRYSAFILNYDEISWNFQINYKNSTINYSIILAFISISGLFLIIRSMYTLF